MSNLSAALNSLSSSTILDFYLRLSPQTEERRRLQLSRFSTVVWAFVLFGLAVLCLHRVARVIEVGLQIASISYGALLGVFLLGVLTRRASQTGAMVGMLCGFFTELYLGLATSVPWTWYVAIGTVVTFAAGYVGSHPTRSLPAGAEHPVTDVQG
jgi:solute:Na+ symporter, SSS family